MITILYETYTVSPHITKQNAYISIFSAYRQKTHYDNFIGHINVFVQVLERVGYPSVIEISNRFSKQIF